MKVRTLMIIELNNNDTVSVNLSECVIYSHIRIDVHPEPVAPEKSDTNRAVHHGVRRSAWRHRLLARYDHQSKPSNLQ